MKAQGMTPQQMMNARQLGSQPQPSAEQIEFMEGQREEQGRVIMLQLAVQLHGNGNTNAKAVLDTAQLFMDFVKGGRDD